VEGGCAGEQVEGLEDKSNFFVADASKLVVVEFADQLSIEPILSAAGRVEAADQVHQG